MSQLERFQSHQKLAAHPEWVSSYLEKGSQYPITLEIDPTNKCPLACGYCIWNEFRGANPDSLPPEVMLRVVNEAASLGVKSIIWTGGGEPLSNPGTVPAILRAQELGVKNAMFSTGVPLTPSRAEQLVDVLSWIRFHVDGATPATYAAVHQVPETVFFKAVENIGNMAALKKRRGSTISLGIGTVALEENIAEAAALARLAKSLGLDYFQYKHDLTQMTDRNYLQWWNKDVVPLFCELTHELEDDTFKLQFSSGVDYESPDVSDHCHVHHLNTAITADGRVAYCKSLRDSAEWSLGNVKDLSLKEIFDSDQHVRLKESVTPTTCGILPCPYKQANILIEHFVQTGDVSVLALDQATPEHADFI